MATKTDDIQRATEKILEILNRLFPHKSDDEFTPQSILEAISEIESLGTIALDTVAALQRHDFLMRIFVEGGERGLKFLEYAAKVEKIGSTPNSEDDGYFAMIALRKVGIPALPILKDLMENSQSSMKRENAALFIAGINDGLSLLKQAVNSETEIPRKSAILGIFQYIYIRFINSGFPDTSKNFVSQDLEPFIELVYPSIADKDSQIRSKAIWNLSYIQRLSINEIATGAEDPIEEVRKNVLSALFRMGINSTTANIYVHFFEDQSGELSRSAVDSLRKPQSMKIDADSVSKAIIEEIIIRKSNRPESFFNPQITANSFEPLFELNPHLYEKVHLTLRDLAFTDDKQISERAIKVGDALTYDYFKQLIRQKAEEFPEKTAKILYQLGENGNPPSVSNSLNNYTNYLQELEDESISRWKDITKQSCVIRSMPTTESGACRPVNPIHVVHRIRNMPTNNPAHVVHFFGNTGIVVGMKRNGGRHDRNQ